MRGVTPLRGRINPSHPWSEGLCLAWAFSADQGGFKAFDYVRHHQGTLNGSLSPGEHSNDPGLSVNGPGTGTAAYMQADIPPTLLANDWTLMIWFNRRTTGGFQGLFRVGVGGTTNLIDCYTLSGSNTVQTDIYNSGGAFVNNVATSTTFSTNRRNSYAVVNRGGTLRNYLNGVEVGSTTFATGRASAQNTLRIGGGSNANIDGVSRALVWNQRGLTASEILNIHVGFPRMLLPARRVFPGAGPVVVHAWHTSVVKVWK